MFAAAGDNGAYDNDDLAGPPSNETPAIITDDPASQPYVTGVGGTILTGSLATHSEVVWNEGCSAPGNNCTAGSSGGGIANYCEDGGGSQVACPGAAVYWSLPSYQTGVAGTHSQTYRNVPDVTLNADPDTFPYSRLRRRHLRQQQHAHRRHQRRLAALGGADGPDQSAARGGNGLRSLGFANPSFYQLAQPVSYATYFNDIKTRRQRLLQRGHRLRQRLGVGLLQGERADQRAERRRCRRPPPVSGLTGVTASVSSIQYSWSALSGATGYNVYYATNSSVVLAVGTLPPFTQSGLIGDETSGHPRLQRDPGRRGARRGLPSRPRPTRRRRARPRRGAGSSSATFTYSACPAFPSPSSCSGYIVQVSPTSGFHRHRVLRARRRIRAPDDAVVDRPGSRSPATSCALGYLEPEGAPSFGPTGAVQHRTNLVAPVSPTFPRFRLRPPSSSPGGRAPIPRGLTYVSAIASTAAGLQRGSVFPDRDRAEPDVRRPDGGHELLLPRECSGRLGGPFLNAGPRRRSPPRPPSWRTRSPAVGAAGFTLSWSGASDQPDTLVPGRRLPRPDLRLGRELPGRSARPRGDVHGALSANTPLLRAGEGDRPRGRRSPAEVAARLDDDPRRCLRPCPASRSPA